MADKVYELVRSLTKSEQRYFHRYAHQHRQDAPNYWKVYDVMIHLPVWDELAFKALLKTEVFFEHLPVVKSHLYDRLLDALHLFHRENELEERVKRALHQAYLLNKRGLKRSFQQHLQKCRKLIETHQLWIFWPELMSLVQQAAENPAASSAASTSAQQWAQDYQYGIDRLEASLPTALLKTELAQVHLQRVRPVEQRIEQWQRTLNETPNDNNPNIKSNRYQSEALIAFMRRDAKAAAQANGKLLEILEQLSPNQRSVPERYLSTLYNFLIDQLQLGEIDAFQNGLQKLRELPSRKGFRRVRGIQRKTFEWGFQLELNHLVKNKEYQLALGRLPELAKGLKTHQAKIAPQAEAGLRHLAGLIAFQEQQAELALQFITPLYQQPKPSVAHEIYHYAELLYILSHFELAHSELVDHLMTSFQRRIRHQKGQYKASLDCLQFIRRLQSAVNKQEKTKIWQAWHEKLSEFPTSIKIYLDLEHWMKRKRSEPSTDGFIKSR